MHLVNYNLNFLFTWPHISTTFIYPRRSSPHLPVTEAGAAALALFRYMARAMDESAPALLLKQDLPRFLVDGRTHTWGPCSSTVMGMAAIAIFLRLSSNGGNAAFCCGLGEFDAVAAAFRSPVVVECCAVLMNSDLNVY